MGEVIFLEKKDEFSDILNKQLNNLFSEDEKVAVKLHMGEAGNIYHLKAEFVKKVVAVLKGLNIKPFLFDSPVIYPGGRDTPEKYYKTAEAHGFTEENIGCPIVISNDFEIVKTEHLNAEVCRGLFDADGLLVLSHVKGHMCSGFGGAIKNLGMGGVSTKTKADIHNFANPMFVADCSGCGSCVKVCPVETISLKDNKAYFNLSGCWGCGVCIDACPSNVLKPKIASFDRLIAEGAYAVLKNTKKAYYVNVLENITKYCDCVSSPGKPVLDDIGIVMGKDIVSVEKASLDLINKKAGKDLFKELNKKSPIGHIIEAEKLGLGEAEYII
ncbi:MAG: DUF362 domain-containing protein [Nanoarchaeota archaeon]